MKESDIRNRDVYDRYLKLVAKDSKKYFNKCSFSRIPCPACDSKNYSYSLTKNRFDYCLCENCKTLFVNPRPSIDKIKEFYTDSISSRFWVEKFFKPFVEARKKKIFKPRADFLNQFFPKIMNKTIGDIGAGYGLFLQEYKKICPNNRFIAIEPSLRMGQICKSKGLEVIPDLVEKISDKYHGLFYILTSFELFEHLGEPMLFLKKVYDLLENGGYLLFTTLNGEGFDIQILWEKSKSIFPPHHLNFFNPVSIVLLLKRIGFVVKEISTPGKLDWDIVEGMYRNERIKIGRFWETFADRGPKDAKEALQDWISVNGFSSHMRIVAQKRK